MVKPPSSSKKGKKRKRKIATSLDSLCNVTGLSSYNNKEEEDDDVMGMFNEKETTTTTTTTRNGELADCLAEFDYNNNDNSNNYADNDNNKVETSITNRKYDDTNDNSQTSPPSPPDLTQCVPNIRIELSRHYQMGQLSSFLLQSFNNNHQLLLRMPVFERWLLDCKLEERFKRLRWKQKKRNMTLVEKKKKKKKRKRMETSEIKEEEEEAPPAGLEYDPVIPTYPSINDDASQRLLSEILQSQQQQQQQDGETSSSKKDKEKYAKFVIQQLCYKCIESAREVANSKQRLDGRNPFLLRDTNTATTPSFQKKKNKKKKKITFGR